MNSEKKLKLILASLKDQEIIKFFDVFSAHFAGCFKKSIRQISFNCYESVCEFKNKIVSGYGKNSNQAYINSIRTLIQLLADNYKMHSILKQSIRLIHSSSDSQNKSITEKSSKNQSMHASIKPTSKKQTLKEQIFQYLNLDNLKISNPNVSKKPKVHDKYMNQSVQEDDQSALKQILNKNEELQKQIQMAKKQNEKLRSRFHKQTVSKIQGWVDSKNQNTVGMTINEHTKSKSTIRDLISQKKPRDSFQPLKQRTNDYLNMSHDTRLRSISVDPSSHQLHAQLHTHKNQSNQQNSHNNSNINNSLLANSIKNQKKINIPKLNLQVLPNYHGKSNKSLNQSLMEIYDKAHK